MPKTTTSSYLRNKKVVEGALEKAVGNKPAPAPAPAPKAPTPPAVPKRTLKEKIKNVASALTEKQPAPMPKNPTKSRHAVKSDGSSAPVSTLKKHIQYKAPKPKTARIGRRTVDDY